MSDMYSAELFERYSREKQLQMFMKLLSEIDDQNSLKCLYSAALSLYRSQKEKETEERKIIRIK